MNQLLSPKVKENKIEIENETQSNESIEDELYDKVESDKTSDKIMQNVRRSNRNRNQRYNIHPDEFGENDDEKYENYQNKSRT